jgi:RNA polymerase sigma factor (sigma-70 family)
LVDDVSVHLLARWRTGDQQAAAELFDRYAKRLTALAQRRLPARLGVRVDAEDIVQSVYRSFFIAARNGRYVLERSGDLWRLLFGITMHKVQHQVRYHRAGKRDVDLEQPAAGKDGVPSTPEDVTARESSGEDAVALSDLLEQAMAGIDLIERRMIELRLQGYRVGEIASDTGRCVHTVLRVMDRFKKRLERMEAEGQSEC